MTLTDFIILGTILGIIGLLQNLFLASYFAGQFALKAEVSREKDIQEEEKLLADKIEKWKKEFAKTPISVQSPTISKTKIVDDIKNQIRKVLKGTSNSVILEYCRPQMVIDALEQLGLEHRRPYQLVSEGWEWKYQIDFHLYGNDFSLTGDGFYSNNCIFFINNKTK